MTRIGGILKISPAVVIGAVAAVVLAQNELHFAELYQGKAGHQGGKDQVKGNAGPRDPSALDPLQVQEELTERVGQ